ncbi:MAG: hypothetical protein CENE_00007 [Candidatus Celerinatantimonas neptuna]|nr:MAG: hypothetical protein CENE_00007 [Candidatus Celerinatantimonas neptuna]
MSLKALQRSIDVCGGQSSLANKINQHSGAGTLLQPTNIRKWVQLKRVPGKWVLKVEQASGVPCWELRPDLYPPERFHSQVA